MPLSLATILAPTATSELAYLGESLTIHWRPNGLTPETQEQVNAVADKPAGQQTEVLIKILVDIVGSWDLLDDKGKPIPVNRAQLTKLPLPFLWDVFNFLGGEAAPKAESALPSSEP